MTFILIHSPLVGPLFWKPTASALTSAGCAAITPRADIRRCFVEELRPMPLRVYGEPIPVGIGVEERDHGYVLLTGQYQDSFDIASARGWVTERHESSHFHPLNDPARMAGMLVRVGTRIGERRRR